MARFMVFVEGLPSGIERRTLVRKAAIEDCHSSRGYSLATSTLSAAGLADQITDEAVRLGAIRGQFRVVVLRVDESATRGTKTIEDCF